MASGDIGIPQNDMVCAFLGRKDASSWPCFEPEFWAQVGPFGAQFGVILRSCFRDLVETNLENKTGKGPGPFGGHVRVENRPQT